MKTRNMGGIPVLVLWLAALVALTGCASGGGRSRGSLSDATAKAGGKEEAKGRGEGRTRTKDDVYQPGYYEDTYQEEESGGGGFLFGLIASIFTSDDEPEVYDPYDYPEFQDGEDETWSDSDEFGLEPLEKGDDRGDEVESQKDGDEGGLDLKRGNLNFWYSRSLLAGDAIEGFSTYTLMYSGYTGRRYRAHAGLYYGRGRKGGQENLQEGLRWISEGGIDIGSRGYLTPDHSLLGLYVVVGLRVGALYWSYTNAIETVADDGTSMQVSKDGLMVFTPYVGLGTSLLQTKKVHLGVNFTLGGRIHTSRTFKDYSNDLFRDVGEYKLNFEASFFF